jgi:serine/threonine-protein kinase HipA
MALTLGGKNERLRRADFVALATLAGLRAGDANAAIDDALHRLRAGIDTVQVPGAFRQGDAAAVIAKTLGLCRGRIESLLERRAR